jgi:hypothetical protein
LWKTGISGKNSARYAYPRQNHHRDVSAQLPCAGQFNLNQLSTPLPLITEHKDWQNGGENGKPLQVCGSWTDRMEAHFNSLRNIIETQVRIPWSQARGYSPRSPNLSFSWPKRINLNHLAPMILTGKRLGISLSQPQPSISEKSELTHVSGYSFNVSQPQ